MTKKEVDKKFDEIVEFADIGDFLDTPVKYYSSGMFVRLGFAIAVHADPDILLVDEVLAVGDIHFQVKCFGKMKEFKGKGKTIIIVTHDIGTILKHTDKVLLLHRGSLSCVDKPQNVANRYLMLTSDVIKEKKIGSNRHWLTNQESQLENKTFQLHEDFKEDLCPKRPNYNRNEFRYGNGFARIVDYHILNTNGEEITSIKSMDIVRFQIKVKGYRFVEKPILGIIVKTKDGIELYGNNTLYAEIDVPPIKEGKELVGEFRLHINLQPGDYFFSAGVAETAADGILPLDRRYDLVHITVLPSDNSFGLVNLATDIRVFSEETTV